MPGHGSAISHQGRYAEGYLETHTIQDAIDSAVDAIQRGDLGHGKATLTWVLREDPNNRLAWLWMACCVNEDGAREECYRRASWIPT